MLRSLLGNIVFTVGTGFRARDGTMRGRKPKLRSLRIVGGNAVRRPLNRTEPMPTADVPEPPDGLGEEATAEWRWITKELHHAGILTKLDRPALIAYCWSYGLWSQAERILAAMAAADPETRGLVIHTSN